MPKAIYFFDTINAVKNYDSYFGGVNGNFYHSYNIYFPLKTPLQNVKRITLKSVEMPLNLYTARLENNTCTMGLTFTYTSLSGVVLINNKYINYQIPMGVYTQSSLLSSLNTGVNAFLNTYNTTTLATPYYITISGVTNTYYTPGNLSISFGTSLILGTTVTAISNNCTSLSIDNNPLTNYLLGYTNRYSISSSSTPLYSNSPINVNGFDTCLYMQFPNIPNLNNSNSFVGFKLPLNSGTNNTTLYYNDATEHQSIELNKTPYILDKINVVITDRLGNALTGYFNWTFSLIIEYDDSISYEYLNFNN